ncbi:MAG: hypothetical protein LIO91_07905 [Bacteroidales bacterium]|nr:hypothetical protein [Bacteroidales bacterium]
MRKSKNTLTILAVLLMATTITVAQAFTDGTTSPTRLPASPKSILDSSTTIYDNADGFAISEWKSDVDHGIQLTAATFDDVTILTGKCIYIYGHRTEETGDDGYTKWAGLTAHLDHWEESTTTYFINSESFDDTKGYFVTSKISATDALALQSYGMWIIGENFTVTQIVVGPASDADDEEDDDSDNPCTFTTTFTIKDFTDDPISFTDWETYEDLQLTAEDLAVPNLDAHGYYLVVYVTKTEDVTDWAGIQMTNPNEVWTDSGDNSNFYYPIGYRYTTTSGPVTVDENTSIVILDFNDSDLMSTVLSNGVTINGINITVTKVTLEITDYCHVNSFYNPHNTDLYLMGDFNNYSANDDWKFVATDDENVIAFTSQHTLSIDRYLKVANDDFYYMFNFGWDRTDDEIYKITLDNLSEYVEGTDYHHNTAFKDADGYTHVLAPMVASKFTGDDVQSLCLGFTVPRGSQFRFHTDDNWLEIILAPWDQGHTWYITGSTFPSTEQTPFCSDDIVSNTQTPFVDYGNGIYVYKCPSELAGENTVWYVHDTEFVYASYPTTEYGNQCPIAKNEGDELMENADGSFLTSGADNVWVVLDTNDFKIYVIGKEPVNHNAQSLQLLKITAEAVTIGDYTLAKDDYITYDGGTSYYKLSVGTDSYNFTPIDAPATAKFLSGSRDCYQWTSDCFVNALDLEELNTAIDNSSNNNLKFLRDEDYAGADIHSVYLKAGEASTDDTAVDAATLATTATKALPFYVDADETATALGYGAIMSRLGNLASGQYASHAYYNVYTTSADAATYELGERHGVASTTFAPEMPKPYNFSYFYRLGQPTKDMAKEYPLADYLKFDVTSTIPGHTEDEARSVLIKPENLTPRTLDCVITFQQPNVTAEILTRYDIYYTVDVTSNDDEIGTISTGTFYDDCTTTTDDVYEFVIENVHPSKDYYPTFRVIDTQYRRRSDTDYSLAATYGSVATVEAKNTTLRVNGEMKTLNMGLCYGDDPDVVGWVYYGHTDFTDPGDQIANAHQHEYTEDDNDDIEGASVTNESSRSGSLMLEPVFYHVETVIPDQSYYFSHPYLAKHDHGTGDTDEDELIGTCVAHDAPIGYTPTLYFTPVYIFSRTASVASNEFLTNLTRASNSIEDNKTDSPRLTTKEVDSSIYYTYDGHTVADLSSEDYVAVAGGYTTLSTQGTMNTTGVENVKASTVGETQQYYNLQGVRVASPVKGQIYILRQGDRAYKIRY